MDIVAWAWTFDGDHNFDKYWNKNKPLPNEALFLTYCGYAGWKIAIRMSNGQLVKVRRK